MSDTPGPAMSSTPGTPNASRPGRGRRRPDAGAASNPVGDLDRTPLATRQTCATSRSSPTWTTARRRSWTRCSPDGVFRVNQAVVDRIWNPATSSARRASDPHQEDDDRRRRRPAQHRDTRATRNSAARWSAACSWWSRPAARGPRGPVPQTRLVLPEGDGATAAGRGGANKIDRGDAHGRGPRRRLRVFMDSVRTSNQIEVPVVYTKRSWARDPRPRRTGAELRPCWTCWWR